MTGQFLSGSGTIPGTLLHLCIRLSLSKRNDRGLRPYVSVFCTTLRHQINFLHQLLRPTFPFRDVQTFWFSPEQRYTALLLRWNHVKNIINNRLMRTSFGLLNQTRWNHRSNTEDLWAHMVKMCLIYFVSMINWTRRRSFYKLFLHWNYLLHFFFLIENAPESRWCRKLV